MADVAALTLSAKSGCKHAQQTTALNPIIGVERAGFCPSAQMGLAKAQERSAQLSLVVFLDQGCPQGEGLEVRWIARLYPHGGLHHHQLRCRINDDPLAVTPPDRK